MHVDALYHKTALAPHLFKCVSRKNLHQHLLSIPSQSDIFYFSLKSFFAHSCGQMGSKNAHTVPRALTSGCAEAQTNRAEFTCAVIYTRIISTNICLNLASSLLWQCRFGVLKAGLFNHHYSYQSRTKSWSGLTSLSCIR